MKLSDASLFRLQSTGEKLGLGSLKVTRFVSLSAIRSGSVMSEMSSITYEESRLRFLFGDTTKVFSVPLSVASR